MKSLIIVFVCLTVVPQLGSPHNVNGTSHSPPCWSSAIDGRLHTPFENLMQNYQGYEKSDRFFSFPGDGDKSLHIVDTWDLVDDAFIENYARNLDNTGYWLYTRENPTDEQVLVINDTDSVTKSNFNGEKEVVFLVHGWYGHGRNDLNLILTESFLETKDVNVIVVDWSKLARRNYVTAKSGVATLGAALGQFITWLTKFGASYDRVHLVGFSLGAHLVGNAGRETGAQIKRITALDPAGPLWSKDEKRIGQTDAEYVEVIHTNTALYGFSEPCGDADFYPNGGSNMPGCWLNMCSHSRSYEYMAATVRYDHLYGNRCSMEDISREACSGDAFPMGNSDLSKKGSGVYLVNTGKNYPF